MYLVRVRIFEPQNSAGFPALFPPKVQDNTAKPLPLPRLQWPLVFYGPDLFPDDRQFGGVDHFGVSIAVSEFQGAIPFSLCLAHNGVCWIVLHFGRNPDSRGKDKQTTEITGTIYYQHMKALPC